MAAKDIRSADQTPRIGGELPAFCDQVGAELAWRTNWLGFSHGRAALAWLLDHASIRGVALCAYTCPSVPSFLRRRDLRTAVFDVGASVLDVAARARGLPGPRLVLAPALFGAPPWFDLHELASALEPEDVVVLDAAQTAFGHMDFIAPRGGAVLSCPRKATGLADGAVLALSGGSPDPMEIAALPVAAYPRTMKHIARALWAGADQDLEIQALRFSGLSEDSWPDAPHRMSDESMLVLRHLDPGWHARSRRDNRRALLQVLRDDIPVWSASQGTPFSLPIFVDDRAALLERLREERIFASPLWPDAELDARLHPGADWMAQRLVSLPVDQRHGPEDMERIARAVNARAVAPVEGLAGCLKGFIFSKSSAALTN